MSAKLPPAKLWAVIPAAGVGSRMGAAAPKQFLLLDGLALLIHSTAAMLNCDQIAGVVVVVAQHDQQSGALLTHLSERPMHKGRLLVLAQGGATRSQTVMQGLTALARDFAAAPSDWALVHDAARPGLSQTALNRLIQSVLERDVGGLLALPVTDTVKLSEVNDASTVARTIPRESLWLAQTPQLFRLGQLHRALADALLNNIEVTDEASAMEAAGHPVQLVLGERRNLKVTVPEDLLQLDAMLKGDRNWKFA